MAQVVIKRGEKDFVKEWEVDTKDHRNFKLVETPSMDEAMIFNCENDARRFLHCDRRIVCYYQPELVREF